MKSHSRYPTLALLLLPNFAAATAEAAPLTPGNILIANEVELAEYSPDGALVQRWTVPYGSGPRPSDQSITVVLDTLEVCMG